MTARNSGSLITDTPIVSLTQLRKQYGTTVALDGIDLRIERPCIFGLVGPDGAGKTTLLRSLVGLVEFEAQRAHVLGYEIVREPYRIRERLGYVPQAFSLYPELSVLHNLKFFADVHGVARSDFAQRSEELLAIAGLEDFQTRAAGALSGGMKQKLSIICALIHQPQLLVLDEPNNGVDVIARGEVWDILRHLQDVTVVMSTGYLDEVERYDELVYLYAGRIQTRGTPHQVLSGYPYQAYRLIGTEPTSTLAALQQAPWFIRSQLLAGHLVIETTAQAAQVSMALHNLGTSDVWAEPMPPSFELVFTHLTYEAHTAQTARAEQADD